MFPSKSTSETLSFVINLPDDFNIYELVIIDNNANEIKRERLDFKSFSLNVSDFSSGIYYYILCTKNKTYQAGRFIITK